MPQDWSIDLFPSADEDDIVYVTARNGTATLYAAARVTHKRRRVLVSMSGWETPDGTPVDDKRLTYRAMDLVRDSAR